MPIVTLISDWGSKDHYTASVKGAILKRDPSITIVDISHHVEAFNIPQASFILRNAYPDFPDGTVHMVAINTDESEQTPHLAIFHNGHYFIGTDNGIFPLLFDGMPEKMIEIEIPQDTDYFTFSARDRFVSAAVHLLHGKSIEDLGFIRTGLIELHNFRPVLQPSLIIGKIIYIDCYENAITNISEKVFREIGKNKSFTIQLRSLAHRVKKIPTSYHDVIESTIVVLFGTTGMLEIAINQGNAASLLGLSVDDFIRIEFDDK
ncbi:MAG: SAM-dependent chlorinase/fluorinase [Bacteroidales bacterium]|nr:SAM-dependent chlorinase/fluorinase [Bacteroidales bacterium]MDZ4204821.1 SAM-dependent chlorinase/fluorinase [Bacteroidales bacterium]